MKEKELTQRMKNIHQLTRFGTELKLSIPTAVFNEKNTDFKEQQKALENLKKDNQLAIFEENNKIQVELINGVEVEKDYTVITIRRLDK